MAALIWIGAAMTVVGLLGIMWCILKVISAKRAGLEGPSLQPVMQRVMVVNLAAFALSALGLAAVVAGIILS